MMHAGIHVPVSGPLRPMDADELLQAEHGGEAPQKTAFIQEGMQNLAASIGEAIASHATR